MIWIIPANLCSHAGISPGFKGNKSKFSKYRLSLLRNISFKEKDEKKYNKYFSRKYKVKNSLERRKTIYGKSN